MLTLDKRGLLSSVPGFGIPGDFRVMASDYDHLLRTAMRWFDIR